MTLHVSHTHVFCMHQLCGFPSPCTGHVVYRLLTHMLNTIQAIADELRSQITTLQADLEGAREEIAAWKEHEAKITSQFQVCLGC